MSSCYSPRAKLQLPERRGRGRTVRPLTPMDGRWPSRRAGGIGVRERQIESQTIIANLPKPQGATFCTGDTQGTNKHARGTRRKRLRNRCRKLRRIGKNCRPQPPSPLLMDVVARPCNIAGPGCLGLWHCWPPSGMPWDDGAGGGGGRGHGGRIQRPGYIWTPHTPGPG